MEPTRPPLPGPPWLKWSAGVLATLGLVSVIAIPFVDATRVLPTPAAAWEEPASYRYVLELGSARAGRDNRVEVTVVDGAVADVEVLACDTSVDCGEWARQFAPLGELADILEGDERWLIAGGLPRVSATFDDPQVVDEEQSVAVIIYETLDP